ncbi:MAG: hypothetical protein WD049_04775 [Candidatus Paceibacterota bacterium]
MKRVLSTLLLGLVFALPACSMIPMDFGDQRSALYTRRFFGGDMVYTLASYDVKRGMRSLEELYLKRHGQVHREITDDEKEGLIADLYKQASQGDFHITEKEFVWFSRVLRQTVEDTLPDSLRELAG